MAAPCRAWSPSLPRIAGQKKARIARANFPRSGRLSRTGGRVDRGRRGKGSGHMMGRWYPPASLPAVHPHGPGLRRSGRGLGGALSRRPAARTGPPPGKTRPSRRGYRSEARFLSPVPPRRAPGRRRRRRRSGRRVPGRTPNRPLPSAGRSTSSSLRSGALEGGEGASWRRMVSAGRIRAGSEAGRGLGMTRSSSAAMAARTTPNSSPRATATSCRLGRPGLSRSGLRVIQRSRRGRALHSPRACRWRWSAAASFSARQRRLNPTASVERPTQGAVSQLICSRTARCDADVSRRALIDAAAPMSVSVAGVVFPHCRAVVLAAPINLPAKSRAASSRSVAAARAGSTSPPGKRSSWCAAVDGRSLPSVLSTRSRSHSNNRFTKPGGAGGSGRSAAMATARARSEERTREPFGRPTGIGELVEPLARSPPRCGWVTRRTSAAHSPPTSPGRPGTMGLPRSWRRPRLSTRWSRLGLRE